MYREKKEEKKIDVILRLLEASSSGEMIAAG